MSTMNDENTKVHRSTGQKRAQSQNKKTRGRVLEYTRRGIVAEERRRSLQKQGFVYMLRESEAALRIYG